MRQSRVSISRRRVLGLGGWLGVGVVTASVGGCRSGGAEAVPFGPFLVRESGGVDGRNHLLEVSASGTALLMSRVVAAGQLAEPALARLRTLLTSDAFRREAAASAEEKDDLTCADGVTVSVEMGALRVTSDPCGSRREEARPAYGEILTLLADARAGRFEQTLPDPEPALQTLALTRTTVDDPYAITVRPDGAGTLTRPGVRAVSRRLDAPAQDALRLLQARLAEQPSGACPDPSGYALRVGTGTSCGPLRTSEFRSVVRLLEAVFGV